jgi:hypothetical protein
VSASEYWSKAEALLAEHQSFTADEIADELSEARYILPADRDAVAEAITPHDAIYVEDDVDAHCKCGKWLESNYYEWPDHMGSVLDQWITETGKAHR